MKNYFEILFLEEAFEFLTGLERKHYEKILYYGNTNRRQSSHSSVLRMSASTSPR
jgi:hypothetical protein